MTRVAFKCQVQHYFAKMLRLAIERAKDNIAPTALKAGQQASVNPPLRGGYAGNFEAIRLIKEIKGDKC